MGRSQQIIGVAQTRTQSETQASHKTGKGLGKVKQISREFYDQINETAEIEEINDLKNNLNKHTDLESYVKDSDIGVRVKKSDKVKLKKK